MGEGRTKTGGLGYGHDEDIFLDALMETNQRLERALDVTRINELPLNEQIAERGWGIVMDEEVMPEEGYVRRIAVPAGARVHVIGYYENIGASYDELLSPEEKHDLRLKKCFVYDPSRVETMIIAVQDYVQRRQEIVDEGWSELPSEGGIIDGATGKRIPASFLYREIKPSESPQIEGEVSRDTIKE